MKRGEIYYIEASKQYQTTGSEQKPDRPAIIVSNNANNDNAQTVEVVFLTTQEKPPLPTHVAIRSANRISTALCEQINTVSIERVANYMGECTEEEMRSINKALAVSIGFDYVHEWVNQAEYNLIKNQNDQYRESLRLDKEEITKLTAERDVIKSLFKSTIQEIISKQ